MFILFLVLHLTSCLLSTLATTTTTTTTCNDRRPTSDQRRFISTTVDTHIAAVVKDLQVQNHTLLACVFANTLPNTLDTTVLQAATTPNDTSFVITGDINAMWLRDSMNQVLPYMSFAKQDPHLQQMLAGIVNQQTLLILADPWANAHNLPNLAGSSPNVNDQTTYPGFGPSRSNAMVPGIYERKYELDTLCAFLKISRTYYEATSDLVPFQNAQWIEAVRAVVTVMKDMQEPTSVAYVQAGGATYQFQRQATEPTDTLLHGVGHPGAFTGMIRSAFRPSDDATTFPFLVPANAMAVVELRKAAAVVQALTSRGERLSNDVKELNDLANVIDHGIQTYGIGYHPTTGKKMYAYEVDGYGNMYFADDANVPSLLSLPYLGYVKASDPVYAATREFVWSTQNPWFFSGKAGEGIGGPHVGFNSIWPMSIIMKALTTDDTTEIQACLMTLLEATASTGLMHESFDKDDSSSYTRPWFAWANSLFGELIMKVYSEEQHRGFLYNAKRISVQ